MPYKKNVCMCARVCLHVQYKICRNKMPGPLLECTQTGSVHRTTNWCCAQGVAQGRSAPTRASHSQQPAHPPAEVQLIHISQPLGWSRRGGGVPRKGSNALVADEVVDDSVIGVVEDQHHGEHHHCSGDDAGREEDEQQQPRCGQSLAGRWQPRK